MKTNYVLLVCALLGCTSFGAADRTTLLTKAFYNQGKLSDKIVLYFDKEPLCNQLPVRPNLKQTETKVEITLILPLVSIGSDAKNAVHKINKIKHDGYSISVSHVDLPVKGIRVLISYNPELVTLDYSTCDVISAQKGLVISFHDKRMLEKIKQASNPILRYASVDNRPKKKIVIDYGHGGSDNGTIGCHHLKEKDVTLQVGKKVVALLKEKGFDVSVTRDRDCFVALDQRTSAANNQEADLFVSIHANSGISKEAQGVETHWTPRSLLHKKIDAAAASCRDILELWYANLDKQTHLLAQCVHKNLIHTVHYQYADVIDRGTKKSNAQVLIGTDMPSALIEIGFLSHKAEAARLGENGYQTLIATGICKGIEAYCKQVPMS
ncbi:MAG: N-acetylmuramoyl-L-alanine amidase AmiB precursor [Candidatus Dependentiae bacterium ADurb.Bin331]|nr:MAG: N-acetylmuramoyl-L-alanine amidase AmiB precursor [Candidatus Dependentiae bacterium ADurb.Bin331]